jgi:hypothetical protein
MTDKIKEEVKKSDDGLAAKVRKLEETIKTVVATLERQFGIDINRDGKVGLLAFLIAFSGLVAVGQTKIWNVLKADGTDAVAVYNDGSIVAAGAITTAGAVTAVPALASASTSPAIQSDTNATTTITLYAPTKAGDMLIGKEGGSNRIWFATGATTNSWTIKLP